MSEASQFDWAAEALERHSSWNRLETRGALRLVLQKVGRDAKALTRQDLLDLLQGALLQDLTARGMRDADVVCKKVVAELQGAIGTAATAEENAARPLFEWLADAIEAKAGLARLQARGAVRLWLKEAGLTPEELTKQQTAVVLAQVAPRQLRKLGVSDPEAVCRLTLADMATASVIEPAMESPEEIFRRLGSRAVQA